MDRPWEAFDRARRVLRGRDDLVGWKSADLPSVYGTKIRRWDICNMGCMEDPGLGGMLSPWRQLSKYGKIYGYGFHL